MAAIESGLQEGIVNGTDKTTNFVSNASEPAKGDGAFIDLRQHPRGSEIENLADLAYKVLRQYQLIG